MNKTQLTGNWKQLSTICIPYSKNIGGEKTLANLGNYSILPSFRQFAVSVTFQFPMQMDFNSPKFFSAKLPTVLIHLSFLHQSFLLYGS